MIPYRLQVVLVVAILVYFIFILYFLKKHALELKYTLIWIFAGVIMLILVAFPEIMAKGVRIFGIQSSMNGLYIALISFIIMILMMLTSIVSKLSYKVKKLIQECALLEKRIRELENMELCEDKRDNEGKGSN